MTERPLLMYRHEVIAVLDGLQTQFRRVAMPRARFGTPGKYTDTSTITDVRCPYGRPGDHLWVQETWQTTKFFVRSDGTSPIAYLATDADPATGFGPYDYNWQSPILMPRWASRITLEILAVRVERLQEISTPDTLKEDIDPDVDLLRQSLIAKSQKASVDLYHQAHTVSFAALWDSINARRGADWHSNPWVWVVEFKKLA